MVERGPRVEVEHRHGVAMIALASPILTVQTLADLLRAVSRLAAETCRRPLILHSTHPSVFLAGAHLAEIAALDAVSSAAYARLGRQVIDAFSLFPAPTIAAVTGSCSGGGFDLVLACDVVVAGADTRFSHPGIRRGLITGWSGTTLLPAAAGRATAVAALLETRDLEASSLERHGAVHPVEVDPLSEAIDIALRLASLEPSRLHIWRALRGPSFIDRFHASVVHKL